VVAAGSKLGGFVSVTLPVLALLLSRKAVRALLHDPTDWGP